MKEKTVGSNYINIQSKNHPHNCTISKGNESTELICKYLSQIKKKSPVSTQAKEEHQILMKEEIQRKTSHITNN